MSFLNSDKSIKRTQNLEFRLNANTKPITFAELLYFIQRNRGHERDYILDVYDCKHFAHQLYSDAIADGIESYFVAIEIENSPVGHAISAFQTSDQGLVFVDFTPTKVDGEYQKIKRLVWLESGKNYLSIPLDKLYMGFENRYSSFLQYHNQHEELARDGREFHRLVEKYQRRTREHNARLSEYNSRVQELNRNRTPLSSEQIEEIHREKAALDQQSQDLMEQQVSLEREQENLIYDQEELGLATSRWIVKSYQIFPRKDHKQARGS